MARTTPAVLGVTLLCGCAQLAGIEETSSGAARVSLTVERVSVGATVVREPMDLSANTATYLVPDDAEPDGLRRIDAELNEMDTWSASVPGDPPPILFDLPDYPVPIQRLYEMPQREVFTTFATYGHPNLELVAPTATLTVQAALPTPFAANESFQLSAIGTWDTRAFTAMELPAVDATALGPVTFPMSSTTSPNGRPPSKITTADAVLLLRYIGNRLTGVMEATPFDQTGADMIMGTMTAVAADQTLSIMVGPPAAVAARFAPARPAVPNLTMVWRLHAAPGAELAATAGPLLHQAQVMMADTGSINVTYGNPFVSKGWPTTLTWQAVASRTYTPAGQMLPATLDAGLVQIAAPTPGLVLDFPAGLPEVITLDGLPMSTDGVTIAQPTAPVHVSFVSAIATNTLYVLELMELVPNSANTALVDKLVVAATAAEPDFTLPPELFVPGKIYHLRAECIQGGFPAAADGDLRQFSLPYATGHLDGGVFTVTP